MKSREVITIVVAVLVVGLLFVALKLSGGGNPKSVSEKPMPPSESAESSADTPKSLSDAAVEQLLKEAVDGESLEERNDLFYQDDKPYSGWAKRMHDSGQPETLARLKDGKMDGLYVVWRKNGKKKYEQNYKEGEMHGLYVEWHENGQKKSKENYKDGKRDGLYVVWNENGQKEVEGTFKGDEQDGLWTKWHENGQKLGEETYKDAEPDGLWATWHKNGQKRSEGTYKDGKFVDGSDKYWNSKGEEVAEEESWK